MKNLIRYMLQNLFGFETYLFIFSLFSIRKVGAGTYEKEFLFFIGLLKDKGIALDVGANIGITAIPMAKRLPSAQIHAFEPIKENFRTLKRVTNWFKLKNIALYNFALGNEDGSLKMIMPIIGKAKMQGLSKAYTSGSNEKGEIYEVPIKKLDDLYPDETEITAIKIDVENFEYEVLKGARNLLLRCKPIIYCELWDNENRKLVFDLVRSLEYKIFTYEASSASLIQQEGNTIYSTNNFFFI